MYVHQLQQQRHLRGVLKPAKKALMWGPPSQIDCHRRRSTADEILMRSSELNYCRAKSGKCERGQRAGRAWHTLFD